MGGTPDLAWEIARARAGTLSNRSCPLEPNSKLTPSLAVCGPGRAAHLAIGLGHEQAFGPGDPRRHGRAWIGDAVFKNLVQQPGPGWGLKLWMLTVARLSPAARRYGDGVPARWCRSAF